MGNFHSSQKRQLESMHWFWLKSVSPDVAAKQKHKNNRSDEVEVTIMVKSVILFYFLRREGGCCGDEALRRLLCSS